MFKRKEFKIDSICNKLMPIIRLLKKISKILLEVKIPIKRKSDLSIFLVFFIKIHSYQLILLNSIYVKKY